MHCYYTGEIRLVGVPQLEHTMSIIIIVLYIDHNCTIYSKSKLHSASSHAVTWLLVVQSLTQSMWSPVLIIKQLNLVELSSCYSQL